MTRPENEERCLPECPTPDNCYCRREGPKAEMMTRPENEERFYCDCGEYLDQLEEAEQRVRELEQTDAKFYRAEHDLIKARNERDRALAALDACNALRKHPGAQYDSASYKEAWQRYANAIRELGRDPT